MICETNKKGTYTCEECGCVFHRGMIINDRFTNSDSCPECGREELSRKRNNRTYNYIVFN